MANASSNRKNGLIGKPGTIAAAMLAIVVLFFVLREHWGHALGAFPYLLLLLCPLLHLFHGGHGNGHQHRGPTHTDEK